MDLFLGKDLLHLYFDSKSSIDKSNNRLLSLIISNVNNKFLFNKNYWESIVDERKDDPKLDLYQQLLLYLQSESRIITINSITDFKEDYKKSFIRITEDYKSSFEKNENLFLALIKSENNELHFPYLAIFDRIKKPNNHWLYFNIAAFNPNPLTLRYFDFKSNVELQKFLESLYQIVNKPKIAWIFDRYRNVNHFIFDPLIGKVKFHYMTLNFDKALDKSVNKEISDKLKSSIVFTAPGYKIHERRLILGELIMEIDDDFSNISIDRKTWKIDITCCNFTCKELLKKSTDFKRIL